MCEEEKKKWVDELCSLIENHRPWEWEGSIWKTEAQYWSYLRGMLRYLWSRKWIFKNNYLKEHTYPAPVLDEWGNKTFYKSGKKKGQPVKRKVGVDEITGEEHPVKNLQVDHVSMAGSLNNGYDACLFLFRLLTSPDNMRLLSKETHAIVTHMERNNLTWEEAVVEKKVIEALKQSVNKQKEELKIHGFVDKEISNNTKRKECYKKIFNKQSY